MHVYLHLAVVVIVYFHVFIFHSSGLQISHWLYLILSFCLIHTLSFVEWYFSVFFFSRFRLSFLLCHFSCVALDCFLFHFQFLLCLFYVGITFCLHFFSQIKKISLVTLFNSSILMCALSCLHECTHTVTIQMWCLNGNCHSTLGLFDLHFYWDLLNKSTQMYAHKQYKVWSHWNGDVIIRLVLGAMRFAFFLHFPPPILTVLQMNMSARKPTTISRLSADFI